MFEFQRLHSRLQLLCQCINPWLGRYQLDANSHAPAVPRLGCNMTRADGACFGDAYGSLGCQAYDAYETFECTSAASPPAWCQDAWCYVDEDACARPHGTTYLFQNATVGPAARPQRLTFSYETCGYHNRHEVTGDAAKIRRVLAGRPGGKLRVSFPTGDSSSGYTIVGAKTYADGSLKVPINGGVGGSNRSGAVPVFIDRLLAKAGVSLPVAEPFCPRARPLPRPPHIPYITSTLTLTHPPAHRPPMGGSARLRSLEGVLSALLLHRMRPRGGHRQH